MLQVSEERACGNEHGLVVNGRGGSSLLRDEEEWRNVVEDGPVGLERVGVGRDLNEAASPTGESCGFRLVVAQPSERGDVEGDGSSDRGDAEVVGEIDLGGEELDGARKIVLTHGEMSSQADGEDLVPRVASGAEGRDRCFAACGGLVETASLVREQHGVDVLDDAERRQTLAIADVASFGDEIQCTRVFTVLSEQVCFQGAGRCQMVCVRGRVAT